MKKFIIALVLTFSSFSVYAQTEYAVTWNMIGFEDFGTQADDTLSLDLKVGKRYVAANGILLDDEGWALNATGTCFFTTDNYLICTLSIDWFSLEIEINLDSTNGYGTVFDYDGFDLDDGLLQLNSID